MPDRILLFPGGRVYFVELKRPKGGRLDALQAWWRRKLEGLGFTVWHIYNTEQLNYLELILTDEIERR